MSYEEWLRGLEDSKKAVNNPDVRRNDPEEWACLSDEQRDTIYQWRERDREQQEQFEKYRQRKLERARDYGVYFVGVLMGILDVPHHKLAEMDFLPGIGMVALYVIAGIAICCAVSMIGQRVGEYIDETTEKGAGRAIKGVVAIAIWTAVIAAIFLR